MTWEEEHPQVCWLSRHSPVRPTGKLGTKYASRNIGGEYCWQATLKPDTSARHMDSSVRQDRNIRPLEYGALSLKILKPEPIRGMH